MSSHQTLKLLNTIKTSTSSASHRRRRSSAALSPMMFQSTVPPSYFPHCQQPHHPLYPNGTAAVPNNGAAGAAAGAAGGVNGQHYQQFLPTFVTPATPASSDHQTSYHGPTTAVISPPPLPYYFHTPPISSVGGAGGAAVVGVGKTQQQLFYSSNGHNSNLTRTNSNPLGSDALVHKSHAATATAATTATTPSSSGFQFAFEALPPSHDQITGINNQTTSWVNINTAASPSFSKPATPASFRPTQHSAEHLLPHSHHQPQQRQQNPPSFSFLALNPEPTPNCAAQAAAAQHHLKHFSQACLPGGFFSLTPDDPSPPPCTSAQPITTQPTTSYFPVMPVNPVVQQVAPRTAFATGYLRPAYQRLTKHAISAVDSRDSREFRWGRVLRYVHDVSAPHGAVIKPPSEAWIRQQRQRVLSSPRDDERHSLWDGGSLGTNGVDDFVWDDDLQNGKRFTIPPKSQQGDAPSDDDIMFMVEPSKKEYDLAFGYEVDDSSFHPPAKRTKSNESQKAARRGLHEYLAALKSFELSHVQDMKREAPLAMA
ncbi:hypothetical protein DRE_07464 [Drechslerella stenobrocha 248]|uniref:Uncharacterized protein n=1 Tax=Drechslerella stenobrocha 248 TaxID=1043628 RepID=W7HUH1_9PEZI|nr:hypothetical protein DRE_07464 [Drechslerella stenobrocha 248]